jgi:hypothetical protein
MDSEVSTFLTSESSRMIQINEPDVAYQDYVVLIDVSDMHMPYLVYSLLINQRVGLDLCKAMQLQN